MSAIQFTIQEINKNPRRVFEALVDAYTERLYFHIRKIVGNHEDADDALQNAFIKIWQNIESFKGDSSMFTWAIRIATNEALMLIRKRKMHESDEALMFQTSPNYIDHDETILRLEKAIDSLPQKQKQVFKLRYYDEWTYKKMALELQTSEGALKASYHHAVKKIEEFLVQD